MDALDGWLGLRGRLDGLGLVDGLQRQSQSMVGIEGRARWTVGGTGKLDGLRCLIRKK